MKRNLAGLAGVLALLLVELHPAPADACGVKLTIKTSAPRKAVARTSRPSRVLLIGSPPRRLQRDLTAAGHKVDTAPDAANAKQEGYAVVIVDSNEQAADAKARFGDSTVVVRSGDVGADIRSVEARVARKPVKADDGRDVVAAREVREPIAAGPAPKTPRVVAVKEPAEAPVAEPAVTPPAPAPAPTPAPAPERVATTTRPPDETPRERPARTVKAPAGDLAQEVYFGVNSASVRSKSGITKAARWLEANASVTVTVEGHADPTGSPEANMTLSQSRAESVRDALVEMGVDAGRIEVAAFGDTRVKYGRRDGRNRRVSIEAKK